MNENSNAVQGSETQDSNREAPTSRWLDDRYVDGIWYDTMAGDFCQFGRGNGVVELKHPETGEVYETLERDLWEPDEFVQVPQEAIDDPESFMEEFITDAMREAKDYPMTQYAALLFANENTTVRETDDHSYRV